LAIAGRRARTKALEPFSFGRLEIGMHHVGDPADLGAAPEVVGSGLPSPASRIAQRFQCDIEPNLVAIFVPVGDGLGDGTD
jgi:hypothetical protein